MLFDEVFETTTKIKKGVFTCEPNLGGGGLRVEVVGQREYGTAVALKIGNPKVTDIHVNKGVAATLANFFIKLSNELEEK